MKKFFSRSFIGISIIIILLLFFHGIGILKPIESFIGKVLRVPQESIYSFSLNLKEVLGGYNFKEENEELKIELQKYVIDTVTLKLLERENKQLKEELNFLERQNYSYIVARIIAREPEFNQKIVIINQGSEKGLMEDYPVIVAEMMDNENNSSFPPRGFLIGKTIKVNRYNAWVLLLTDNRSSVAAELLGKKEVYGLVKGERGLSLKIDFMPLGSEIVKGDIVVTSGLENMIPEGLIIGKIEEIESKPGDFFQKAKIKPFISFDNLKVVTVLLPNELSL